MLGGRLGLKRIKDRGFEADLKGKLKWFQSLFSLLRRSDTSLMRAYYLTVLLKF
jgi:hypothetical protein